MILYTEAQLDKAQSTSEEVKPQIVTEQVSPEDPLIKKVIKFCFEIFNFDQF